MTQFTMEVIKMLRKNGNRVSAFILAASFVLLTSCARQADETEGGGAALANDKDSAMSGMPGMPGMAGMGNMDSAMTVRINEMATHMKKMEGLSGDSLRTILPIHRQMAANVLAEMNQEMQKMKMSGSSGWTALIDSVRADLRTMPDLGTAQLRTSMPAHFSRMTRLMQMHHDMMKKMQ